MWVKVAFLIVKNLLGPEKYSPTEILKGSENREGTHEKAALGPLHSDI